jgi:hypothetical protein
MHVIIWPAGGATGPRRARTGKTPRPQEDRSAGAWPALITHVTVRSGEGWRPEPVRGQVMAYYHHQHACYGSRQAPGKNGRGRIGPARCANSFQAPQQGDNQHNPAGKVNTPSRKPRNLRPGRASRTKFQEVATADWANHLSQSQHIARRTLHNFSLGFAQE